MKLHVTLLSAAIASVIAASPVWADNDKETKGSETPTTTSARPPEGARPDTRPPEQKAREQFKDKDDAKALPQTKPAANAGFVQTGKTVHYPGDSFLLKAVVPKSLKDVWEGKAVVKIVITMPGDQGAVVVDVPTTDANAEGDKVRPIVPLPAETMATLPAGDYQMAMIVTKLGGNPLNLNDWYGGFKAMLGVKRVKVAATTTPDAEDPSKTGLITGDKDGDGYADSDANVTPPTNEDAPQCLFGVCATTPPTGGTTTPPTGGTTTPPTGGTTTPPTGGTTTPPTGGTTTPPIEGKGIRG